MSQELVNVAKDLFLSQNTNVDGDDKKCSNQKSINCLRLYTFWKAVLRYAKIRYIQT